MIRDCCLKKTIFLPFFFPCRCRLYPLAFLATSFTHTYAFVAAMHHCFWTDLPIVQGYTIPSEYDRLHSP